MADRSFNCETGIFFWILAEEWQLNDNITDLKWLKKIAVFACFPIYRIIQTILV